MLDKPALSLPNLDLAALAQAYNSGAVTPLALMCQLREQALALSDYNLFTYLLSEEELQKHTQKLDGKNPASLPLYGVPFAIKDNIDLEAVPTTAACPEFSYSANTSAAVVQALLDAGAIPLGKTNLDQFATGLVGTRSPYGEVSNAFLPEVISGGSSSGSAVTLALGLVSFALGTDTAGSGRVPAALNNLVGVKPTKGLLSTLGLVPACRSLDCISLFTLNCDDAALLLGLTARYEVSDPYARPNPHYNHLRFYTNPPTQFRFGVIDTHALTLSPSSAAAYHQAVDRLCALGGEAVNVDFAPFAEAAALLYQGPWVAERQLATRGVTPSAMLPVIQTILAGAQGQTAADAFAAQYRLASLKRVCDKTLEGLRCVVTPTIPRAFTRAEIAAEPIACNSHLGTFTNFMNLLDYAALAVPVSIDEQGLPWGVTLFGPAFSDIQLLTIGRGLHHLSGLPQGAGPYALPTKSLTAYSAPEPWIEVAVCGAHLQGQPLNPQLTERGGQLQAVTRTAPGYRLYALADGKRPALVRDPSATSSIEVEVWRVPTEAFGSFVAAIPAPLGIGRTQLEDGRWVSGFICESGGLIDAREITEFGGWRAWLNR